MSISKEQLHLIERLLNLPDVRVLNVEISEREMAIQVETADDYAICHKCGRKATEFYSYGVRLNLRHFPVFNRRVYLNLRPRRFRCPRCYGRPVTTQRNDWYDVLSGVTRAFAESLPQRNVRLHFLHPPNLYGSPGVNFGSMKNLLFPRPVRVAVEDDQVAFTGAATIHVAGGLLKPFTDQRL